MPSCKVGIKGIGKGKGGDRLLIATTPNGVVIGGCLVKFRTKLHFAQIKCKYKKSFRGSN